MTDKLGSWLARLSDPAGANPAWSPPPFAEREIGRLAKLLDIAANHNVRPAVVSNLGSALRRERESVVTGNADDVDVPLSDLLAKANEARMQDIGRALLLESVARVILGKARDENIPVALVKGVDFAKNAYGGLQLRTFSDIDLLVRPEAQDALGSILAEEGFRDLPPHKMRMEKTERQWIRPDDLHNVVLVEVHTDLVHDPALRKHLSLTYDLYADQRYGGITPAARLVLAALHGATSHLFGRMQYVVDGLMIARSGVDPAELKERAASSGALLPLATMLRLCSEIFACDHSRRLAEMLGPVPWNDLQRRLITPSMVLAAKGTHRWRLLPQRYLYRRLLRTPV